MAGTHSWVLGYVKLARKRGYIVKEVRDGYQFLSKNGKDMFIAHMHPGGRNRANLMQGLVRIGVLQPEERSR